MCVKAKAMDTPKYTHSLVALFLLQSRRTSMWKLMTHSKSPAVDLFTANHPCHIYHPDDSGRTYNGISLASPVTRLSHAQSLTYMYFNTFRIASEESWLVSGSEH